MGAIWVIEKNHQKEFDATSALIGDFPVRKIASIDSLAYLLRLRNRLPPSALIFDARDDDFSVEQVEGIVDQKLPNCPRLYLVNAHSNFREMQIRAADADSYYEISESTSTLSLSRHVGQILDREEARMKSDSHILVYRDLRLDANHFQLQILHQDTIETLPLKEARLLRLFMENAGKCLSRAVIRQSIWDGVKIESRTIDSHISRLRKRIGAAEAAIESLYGDGYKLV